MTGSRVEEGDEGGGGGLTDRACLDRGASGVSGTRRRQPSGSVQRSAGRGRGCIMTMMMKMVVVIQVMMERMVVILRHASKGQRPIVVSGNLDYEAPVVVPSDEVGQHARVAGHDIHEGPASPGDSILESPSDIRYASHGAIPSKIHADRLISLPERVHVCEVTPGACFESEIEGPYKKFF
jgi:hypothetical protein